MKKSTHTTPPQSTARPNCPWCKSSAKVVPIVYGLPPVELWEQEQQGELLLGGCVVEEDSPRWYCKRCEKEF